MRWLVLLAGIGCGNPDPENETELYEEIGGDWCACAEETFATEFAAVGQDTEACAQGLADLVLLFSSDSECTFDAAAAAACVEATRSAETITCTWDTEQTVYYDGVAFEDLADCALAWSCTTQEGV